MSFYIAEECIPIYINDNEASIAYMGSEIEMKYDMEGPQGDSIYFAKLPLLSKSFPCRIYGRNLMFVDAYYLLAESVTYETCQPITSVLFDIHTGRYACLDHWYNVVSVKENFLELSNSFDYSGFVLDDPGKLHWLDM